jgi:DNA polymerase-3 subunit gamma/tau
MFYHKYRPKFFKDVIGQEIVIKILKNFLKQNKPPHGYLFTGERGTGKTSIARIYAKALNCLNLNDSEPCGSCYICKLFDQNKFLDLVEIDAASHRKVEEMRNILEHIGFRPLQGKYKVFIIDEAHSLTEEASNALLKTLEEPPDYSIFILATTEPERILSTIRSRVQRLDFRRISFPQIVTKLKLIAQKEKFDFDEESLYLIAEESGGSLRDAETLFEKILLSLDSNQKLTEEIVSEYLGYLSQVKILKFLELISEKKLDDSLKFIFDIYSKGFDLNLFIKSTLKEIRQLILLKINENYSKHLLVEKSEEVVKKMKKLSETFKIEELKKLSHLFFDAEMSLKREPPSPLLILELALLEYFDVK